MVNEALSRTEIRFVAVATLVPRQLLISDLIRYCTTSEECLLLLHLLHGRKTITQEFDEDGGSHPATADSMARQPTLIILHDLLGLVLDHEEEEAAEDQDKNGGDDKDDSARSITK